MKIGLNIRNFESLIMANVNQRLKKLNKDLEVQIVENLTFDTNNVKCDDKATIVIPIKSFDYYLTNIKTKAEYFDTFDNLPDTGNPGEDIELITQQINAQYEATLKEGESIYEA
ncbi:MAG TPA: hypothetical protein DEA28_02950 [Firmicutes bacterium]|nr:hypothetical protein [Bacillota bacterium]